MTSKTTLAASAAPRAMFHSGLSANSMVRGPTVTYSPAEPALSVEGAMAALREPQEAPEPVAAPEPAAEEPAPAGEAPEAAEEPPEPQSEAEPTAEDLLDPEAAIEEQPEAAEPESDPEHPAIAAPQSWDAAERATFATLPRPAQEIILN